MIATWLGTLLHWSIPAVLGQISGSRADRLRALQTRFKEPDPRVYISILVGVAAVAGIFLMVKLLARWEKRAGESGQPQPWRLFRRVQVQLGLRWFDRFCLWRVARALRLEQPTALLISPLYYDRAVERFLTGRSGARRGQLNRIRSRLYGSSDLASAVGSD